MRSGVLGGVALVLATVLLAGCTGGAPEPVEETSPAADRSAPLTMPDWVDDELAELDARSMPVLGSAEGELPHADTTLTVDVLAVDRHDDGLDLTFRLTPDEEISSFLFSHELSDETLSSEISAVRLISGDEYVAPIRYRADPETWPNIKDLRCLCSKLPRKLGTDGIVLHASFPDFTDAVVDVAVAMPGFSPVAGIPVR
ncbi:hypothetical protein [Microbacterium soli]|uniref:Lipoprotein n=1 Tax=Microbacterium soli TaxID=446075 RepID=A0ABP7NKY8_9MICO